MSKRQDATGTKSQPTNFSVLGESLAANRVGLPRSPTSRSAFDRPTLSPSSLPHPRGTRSPSRSSFGRGTIDFPPPVPLSRLIDSSLSSSQDALPSLSTDSSATPNPFPERISMPPDLPMDFTLAESPTTSFASLSSSFRPSQFPAHFSPDLSLSGPQHSIAFPSPRSSDSFPLSSTRKHSSSTTSFSPDAFHSLRSSPSSKRQSPRLHAPFLSPSLPTPDPPLYQSLEGKLTMDRPTRHSKRISTRLLDSNTQLPEDGGESREAQDVSNERSWNTSENGRRSTGTSRSKHAPVIPSSLSSELSNPQTRSSRREAHPLSEPHLSSTDLSSTGVSTRASTRSATRVGVESVELNLPNVTPSAQSGGILETASGENMSPFHIQLRRKSSRSTSSGNQTLVPDSALSAQTMASLPNTTGSISPTPSTPTIPNTITSMYTNAHIDTRSLPVLSPQVSSIASPRPPSSSSSSSSTTSVGAAKSGQLSAPSLSSSARLFSSALSPLSPIDPDTDIFADFDIPAHEIEGLLDDREKAIPELLFHSYATNTPRYPLDGASSSTPIINEGHSLSTLLGASPHLSLLGSTTQRPAYNPSPVANTPFHSTNSNSLYPVLPSPIPSFASASSSAPSHAFSANAFTTTSTTSTTTTTTPPLSLYLEPVPGAKGRYYLRGLPGDISAPIVTMHEPDNTLTAIPDTATPPTSSTNLPPTFASPTSLVHTPFSPSAQSPPSSFPGSDLASLLSTTPSSNLSASLLSSLPGNLTSEFAAAAALLNKNPFITSDANAPPRGMSARSIRRRVKRLRDHFLALGGTIIDEKRVQPSTQDASNNISALPTFPPLIPHQDSMIPVLSSNAGNAQGTEPSDGTGSIDTQDALLQTLLASSSASATSQTSRNVSGSGEGGNSASTAVNDGGNESSTSTQELGSQLSTLLASMDPNFQMEQYLSTHLPYRNLKLYNSQLTLLAAQPHLFRPMKPVQSHTSNTHKDRQSKTNSNTGGGVTSTTPSRLPRTNPSTPAAPSVLSSTSGSSSTAAFTHTPTQSGPPKEVVVLETLLTHGPWASPYPSFHSSFSSTAPSPAHANTPGGTLSLHVDLSLFSPAQGTGLLRDVLPFPCLPVYTDWRYGQSDLPEQESAPAFSYFPVHPLLQEILTPPALNLQWCTPADGPAFSRFLPPPYGSFSSTNASSNMEAESSRTDQYPSSDPFLQIFHPLGCFSPYTLPIQPAHWAYFQQQQLDALSGQLGQQMGLLLELYRCAIMDPSQHQVAEEAAVLIRELLDLHIVAKQARNIDLASVAGAAELHSTRSYDEAISSQPLPVEDGQLGNRKRSRIEDALGASERLRRSSGPVTTPTPLLSPDPSTGMVRAPSASLLPPRFPEYTFYKPSEVEVIPFSLQNRRITRWALHRVRQTVEKYGLWGILFAQPPDAYPGEEQGANGATNDRLAGASTAGRNQSESRVVSLPKPPPSVFEHALLSDRNSGRLFATWSTLRVAAMESQDKRGQYMQVDPSQSMEQLFSSPDAPIISATGDPTTQSQSTSSSSNHQAQQPQQVTGYYLLHPSHAVLPPLVLSASDMTSLNRWLSTTLGTMPLALPHLHTDSSPLTTLSSNPITSSASSQHPGVSTASSPTESTTHPSALFVDLTQLWSHTLLQVTRYLERVTMAGLLHSLMSPSLTEGNVEADTSTDTTPVTSPVGKGLGSSRRSERGARSEVRVEAMELEEEESEDESEEDSEEEEEEGMDDEEEDLELELEEEEEEEEEEAEGMRGSASLVSTLLSTLPMTILSYLHTFLALPPLPPPSTALDPKKLSELSSIILSSLSVFTQLQYHTTVRPLVMDLHSTLRQCKVPQLQSIYSLMLTLSQFTTEPTSNPTTEVAFLSTPAPLNTTSEFDAIPSVALDTLSATLSTPSAAPSSLGHPLTVPQTSRYPLRASSSWTLLEYLLLFLGVLRHGSHWPGVQAEFLPGKSIRTVRDAGTRILRGRSRSHAVHIPPDLPKHLRPYTRNLTELLVADLHTIHQQKLYFFSQLERSILAGAVELHGVDAWNWISIAYLPYRGPQLLQTLYREYILPRNLESQLQHVVAKVGVRKRDHSANRATIAIPGAGMQHSDPSTAESGLVPGAGPYSALRTYPLLYLVPLLFPERVFNFGTGAYRGPIRPGGTEEVSFEVIPSYSHLLSPAGVPDQGPVSQFADEMHPNALGDVGGSTTGQAIPSATSAGAINVDSLSETALGTSIHSIPNASTSSATSHLGYISESGNTSNMSTGFIVSICPQSAPFRDLREAVSYSALRSQNGSQLGMASDANPRSSGIANDALPGGSSQNLQIPHHSMAKLLVMRDWITVLYKIIYSNSTSATT